MRHTNSLRPKRKQGSIHIVILSSSSLYSNWLP